jgi:hypothetical protein
VLSASVPVPGTASPLENLLLALKGLGLKYVTESLAGKEILREEKDRYGAQIS